MGSDVGSKTAMDFAPEKTKTMDLPAILRLTAAEPALRPNGALRIKLESGACADEEAKAYRKMTASKEAPASKEIRAPQAAVDPEVLLQIPGLKETLRALDSEMHATTSSDMEKRLAVHARILELQGQHVTDVQHALEKTVQSVGQILQQQKMYSKLHEAVGKKVLQTGAATQALEGKLKGMEKAAGLHEELHKETAAGVLHLRKTALAAESKCGLQTQVAVELAKQVQALQKQARASDQKNGLQTAVALETGAQVLAVKKKMGLHSELHAETGAHVLELNKKMGLHSELHAETGAHVLASNKKMGLHSELHAETVAQVLALKKKMGLHSELHLETGAQVLAVKKDSGLQTQVLEKAGKRVLDLQKKVDGIKQTSATHEQNQVRTVESLVELSKKGNAAEKQVSLHNAIHVETNKEIGNLKRLISELCVQSEALSRRQIPVASSGAGADLQSVHAALDRIAAQQAEYGLRLQKHEAIQRGTTDVLKQLGEKEIVQRGRAAAETRAESRAEPRAEPRAAPEKALVEKPSAKKASSSDMLAMLTKSIASSQKTGKRGKVGANI